MPLIEELPDDHHDFPPPSTELSPEDQASTALSTCLHILQSRDTSLEDRYHEILTHIAPITSYLNQSPPPPELQSRLFTLLLPDPSLFIPSDDLDSSDPHPAATSFYRIADALLPPLTQHAETLSPTPAAILALTAFTPPPELLDTLPPPEAETLFQLLRDILKPLFTQPTPSTTGLTPAGRVSHFSHPSAVPLAGEEAWRQKLPSAPSLLSYIIAHLRKEDLEPAWPLLVPPLLSVTDSTHVPTRTAGMRGVRELVERLEREGKDDFLKRTGVGEVFRDVLERGMGFLPPLTAVSESAAVVREGIQGLMVLGGGGRLVRRLVAVWGLVGGEWPAVGEVVLEGIERAMGGMGVEGVVWLKSVVPILAGVMADPFTTASLRLVEKALETEEVVIRNCWPRVGRYVPEILRGCVALWGRVEEELMLGEKEDVERGGALEGVRRKTRRVVGMVKAVYEVEEGGRERWERLREGLMGVEGAKLEGLFEKL